MFHKVSAIIRASSLKAVEENLQRANVRGITVTPVKGYGDYKNFFAADWMKPFVKIEIFTARGRAVADAIVEAAHSGQPGDGIVALERVENVIRIRERRSLHIYEDS
ncbi:MAG: P-II family nitrogen regulator [Xanthomonadales bacterium]|nr:P-II family nitrogen regulator [Xanthomonadales bacterium]